MTLGKKLSSYRKLAGLTQQQLGERLNLSAQAISKWENDLAEPDLSALRTLAELYKVSIDELLDPESGFPDMSADAHVTNEEASEEEPALEEGEEVPKAEYVPPIGFCKICGIAVTEENLGTREPVIACQKCLAAKKEEARRAELLKKQQAERQARIAKAKQDEYLGKIRKGAIWHSVVAGLAAAVFLAIMIAAMVSSFSVGLLVFTIIGTYAVFSLVFCLFYDTWVEDVVFEWTSKVFQAPGLIFTFDLDGCLWLIGMKLLFWLIGALFGLVCGAIGIAIAFVIAPFVFPYVIYHIRKSLKTGTECEVSWEMPVKFEIYKEMHKK